MLVSPFPVSTLNEVRDKLPTNKFRELLDWFSVSRSAQERFDGQSFPSNLSGFSPLETSIKTTLERELRWARVRLLHQSVRVSRYLELKRLYERHLARDEYSQCESIMDVIKDDLGISLWLIKTRLHFIELTQGLEAQKKYVSEIKKITIGNGIVTYVTHYSSVRNEANVTLSRYGNDLVENIHAYQIPPVVAGYILHHLLPYLEVLGEEVLAGIMRLDSELSAVDHYEAFIAACTHLVTGASAKLRSLAGQSALRLRNRIPDPRLTLIANDLGELNSLDSTPAPCNIQPFEAMLKGDQSVSAVRDAWEKEPYVFEHVITAVEMGHSPTALSGTDISDWFTEHMKLVCNVMSWNELSPTAVGELAKIATNTATLSWGSSVQSFLLRTVSPLTPQTETLYATTSAGMSYAHPIRLDGLRDSELRATSQRVLTGLQPATEAYVKSFVRGRLANGIPKPSRSKLEVAVATATGHWEWVATEINLDRLPKGPELVSAIRALARGYIETGQLEDAVRLIAMWSVQVPELARVLPIAEVGTSLNRDHLATMKAELALPVFLDVYARHVGADRIGERADAAEDFLESHGVMRPSELAPFAERFNQNLLLYYLRYVCVESVMDSSIAYLGSRELAEERQAVCSLLATIDPANADIYTAEAHEIGRRLAIQRRLREIETSRIYVDVEGVRRASEAKVREAFNRYTAYLRDGIDEETSLTLREVTRKADSGDVDALIAMHLPHNEVRSLLAGILSDVRDEFVSSTEHGLDGYLSVRVRHGTLSNELRIPMESNNLITQTDGETGLYKENKYWIEYFDLETDESRILSDKLNVFSRGFDELVQEMKDTWIQVKRRPEDPGLFDFVPREFEISFIASRTNENTQFDEFLDLIIELLQTRLDLTLKVVQKEVIITGKKKANRLLTNLLREIDEINLGWRKGELATAINLARTSMSAAFDRVGEWFQLSARSRKAAFTLNEVIEISETHIQRSVPGFRAKVSYNVVEYDDVDPKEAVIVNNLVSFGDVLNMALDNVVRHSKLKGNLYADIVITFVKDDTGDRIRFLVENDLGPGVATPENISRISELREELHSDRLGEAVTTEGGTGLLKIWKTLLHDFDMPDIESKPDMDFGYVGKNRFFLMFEFPVRFSKLDENSNII